MQGMPIMSLVRNGVDEDKASTIIDFMLVRLSAFFNLKRNLTTDQIFDISTMIVAEFSDMSLESIQHCLNSVMLGKPPFAEKLYESIDGRKVMDWLRTYRTYLIEAREAQHKEKVADAAEGYDKMLHLAPAPLLGKLAEMARQERLAGLRAYARREREAEEKRAADKEAEVKALVQKWTEEYNTFEQPVGTLDEYIQYQYESYEAEKRHTLSLAFARTQALLNKGRVK
jgi:hypothetical protein